MTRNTEEKRERANERMMKQREKASQKKKCVCVIVKTKDWRAIMIKRRVEEVKETEFA